ncbi:MAG: hypothetical protein ABR958_07510, partial [Dehalococcoidales bacterium]
MAIIHFVDGLRLGQQLTDQGKCQYMKGLTLTTKEQTRLYIINTVLERRISVAEAAQLLGVSERHTW